MNQNIGNTGDMSEMLAKMLSDPEALGKVMNIASTLSASGAFSGISLGGDTSREEKPRVSDNEIKQTVAPTYDKEEKHIPHRPQIRQCDRIRLLEAMRPFLGEDKRDKLDVVIKILGLAEAAGGLYSFKR